LLENVWFWGEEMMFLDGTLHLFGALLRIGEWHSIQLLQQLSRVEAGRSPVSSSVWYCHGALSKMLTATVDRSLLLGFFVGTTLSEVVNISHLFADDTLVFCGANNDHFRYLCIFFLCFEAVSGLKVNLAKSVFASCGYCV